MVSREFFVMIKPDGVERRLVGKLLSRFEKRGFEVRALKLFDSSSIKSTIEEHYRPHAEKTFYQELIDFSTQGHIVAIILYGNLEVARTMIGATRPWDATPGTIRGDYASSLPQNLVHCSCDVENARREVELWTSLF